MKRIPRRPLVIAGLATLGLILSGCGYMRDSDAPLNTLDPQGPQAQKIDDLGNKVYVVAAIVFVLVEGGIIYMIFRFRRRSHDEDGVKEPVQTHGHTRLEIAWTIVPAVILAVLAVGNVTTILDLEEVPDDALPVEVVGQQWWWEYRYDIDDDGAPDIITANQMVIPAGRMIDLEITSNDVIHSFWIPKLNGKRDAVPGYKNDWTLEADEPGTYQGTCTEFCGLSHAYMRMEVKALSPADFDRWVEDQLKPPAEPEPGSLEAEGRQLFEQQCAQCHQINGYDPDAEPDPDTDGQPNPDYRGAAHPLSSANAPNLTHLMSRDRFAGNLFALYDDEGQPNVANLGAWLRDPVAMKPANAQQNRGMPNLGLSEEQINALVAYLTTLE